MSNKISAIIVAGGASTRFGENKLLVETNGSAVITHTLSKFENLVDEIVLVANPNFIHEFYKIIDNENIVLVAGGDSRTQSVINGLAVVTGDIVLIHDGARPFVSRELIKRCINDVQKFGSAVPCVKTIDSIGEVSGDKIMGLLNRFNLYNIQTPQGFITTEIKRAYQSIEHEYPDDSSVFMTMGLPHITEGEYTNHKITVREDLKYFDMFAPTGERPASAKNTARVGSAFDTHRLVVGRRLVLGGVEIDYHKGLLGHSDADIILHALTGAVLNALGLKDIGTYFPDTDEDYRDANSADLLSAVLIIMKSMGYKVGNISVSVVAEEPKLAPYIDKIKQNLSLLLNLPTEDIGLGATTAEKLGDIGRGDSMACVATVMIKG